VHQADEEYRWFVFHFSLIAPAAYADCSSLKNIMDEALKLYSWQGFLTEKVKATEIKSRADLRKHGSLFADKDKKKLVYWVNWGKLEKTNRWRRAHFKHYPKDSSVKHYPSQNVEIEERQKKKGESPKHKLVKDYLVTLLKRMIANGKPAIWSFVDPRISQFPLTGNLLSDVIDVQQEYSVQTSFGKMYKLDIALIGEKIRNKPIILGAIEIEFNHEFELLKCLICKSSGFPLISIDITEVKENEITEKWCESTLLETTTTSGDDRRRNYVYIHDMLYPVYVDIPDDILKETRHQYIVFVNDEEYEQLLKWLNILKESLGINGNEVLIQPVNCNNDQMLTMLRNDGSIAGHDWASYNNKRYIKVNLDRPKIKSGNLYKYHLIMANLLNSYFETLVGYKYKLGVTNHNPDDHIWSVWHKQANGGSRIKVLPKHVSEPVRSIMEILKQLN